MSIDIDYDYNKLSIYGVAERQVPGRCQGKREQMQFGHIYIVIINNPTGGHFLFSDKQTIKGAFGSHWLSYGGG